MKIAVFVSGRGTNLQAILNSIEHNKSYIVEAVISNRSQCPAFDIAKKNSIANYCLGKLENEFSYSQLNQILNEKGIELIVLSGYLKIVPPEFVKKFDGKIINIHPALLPSFGGKGMYGINVHKAVFQSSAKVSGATVHFVDETYDTGMIIAQKCVDISDVKSPEEIADRVLNIEHQLLPYVVNLFAQDKIKIVDNRSVILT